MVFKCEEYEVFTKFIEFIIKHQKLKRIHFHPNNGFIVDFYDSLNDNNVNEVKVNNKVNKVNKVNNDICEVEESKEVNETDTKVRKTKNQSVDIIKLNKQIHKIDDLPKLRFTPWDFRHERFKDPEIYNQVMQLWKHDIENNLFISGFGVIMKCQKKNHDLKYTFNTAISIIKNKDTFYKLVKNTINYFINPDCLLDTFIEKQKILYPRFDRPCVSIITTYYKYRYILFADKDVQEEYINVFKV